MPQRPKDAKTQRQDERNAERDTRAGHRPKTAKADGAAATRKTRRMKGA